MDFLLTPVSFRGLAEKSLEEINTRAVIRGNTVCTGKYKGNIVQNGDIVMLGYGISSLAFKETIRGMTQI